MNGALWMLITLSLGALAASIGALIIMKRLKKSKGH